MPREQSELTGMKPRSLVARLTERQKITFLRLGGSKWIRKILDEEVLKYEKSRQPVQLAEQAVTGGKQPRLQRSQPREVTQRDESVSTKPGVTTRWIERTPT